MTDIETQQVSLNEQTGFNFYKVKIADAIIFFLLQKNYKTLNH
jgi:hypothetical protein